MRHAKIAGHEEKKETQDEAKIVSISEVRERKAASSRSAKASKDDPL